MKGTPRAHRGALLLLALVAAGCRHGQEAPSAEPAGAPSTAGLANGLQVVATTSVLGDLVTHVAGDRAEVTVVVPGDVDPTDYVPDNTDLDAMADADLLVTLGPRDDPFLPGLVRGRSPNTVTLPVPDGAGAARFPWLDPKIVEGWVDPLTSALSAADPAGAAIYAKNAARLRLDLAALDAMVGDMLDRVPPERRVLVSDIDALGALADRYGFTARSALTPTLTAALASKISDDALVAALHEAVTVDPAPTPALVFLAAPGLSRRIGELAGSADLAMAPLAVTGLTSADGPAATYMDLMRYDAEAIYGALGEAPDTGSPVPAEASPSP